MLPQAFFVTLLFVLHVISAQNPLGELERQSKPCFPMRRAPRSCNATLAESFTPESPNLLNAVPKTSMYLFPPGNRNLAEGLHLCGGSLQPGSRYDPNADTEIFIHGWLDGVCRTAWMREMKEQMFNRAQRTNTPFNVILVDWTWGNRPDYYVSGMNAKIVGEQVGFVINNIMRQTGVGPEKFHVIGHSFGATAAGFAGKTVQKAIGRSAMAETGRQEDETRTGIRRITLLDPARAPYAYEPPEEKATYRDAQLVDVIHTNSFDCFPIGFSRTEPLGDADFYPNGGFIQPPCVPYAFTSLAKGDLLYGLFSFIPPLCNHLFATEYYKVTINPQGCEFVGVESDSYEDFLSGNRGSEWAVMGMDYELYHKNDEIKRKYYLNTKDTCPYYDDSYLTNKTFPFKTSCTK